MSLKADKKYDKFNRIQNIVDFIEKNYAQNHSVEFYADTCKVEKYYFIKLFREYTGVSPYLYKTKIRLEKAKELLRNTEMNNSEIAEQIGYSSSYYFSRIFKTHEGISPGTFRKNLK